MLRDLLDQMRRLLSAPANEDKNAVLTRLCAVLACPSVLQSGPDPLVKLEGLGPDDPAAGSCSLQLAAG